MFGVIVRSFEQNTIEAFCDIVIMVMNLIQPQSKSEIANDLSGSVLFFCLQNTAAEDNEPKRIENGGRSLKSDLIARRQTD